MAPPIELEKADERKHTGHIFVRSCSHHSHILADEERPSSGCDEDLTHDYEGDTVVWLMEVNNESYTEYLESKHAERDIFKAASDSNDSYKDKRSEVGAAAINIGYIASVGDREVVNGLEGIVESCVPTTVVAVSICGLAA
jgi:hypothetical protein